MGQIATERYFGSEDFIVIPFGLVRQRDKNMFGNNYLARNEPLAQGWHENKYAREK